MGHFVRRTRRGGRRGERREAAALARLPEEEGWEEGGGPANLILCDIYSAASQYTCNLFRAVSS